MVNSYEQAGFIYEPTSGLYYDTKTKYYYSPQHDLYYNGSNGSWYRLNPRTNEFSFHSGTQAEDPDKQKVELIGVRLVARLIICCLPCDIAGSVGAIA
jgi:OCRE domain